MVNQPAAAGLPSTACGLTECVHHFVSHPAKEEGIGLVEVFHRVTM
jgi:hypothetical protein